MSKTHISLSELSESVQKQLSKKTGTTVKLSIVQDAISQSFQKDKFSYEDIKASKTILHSLLKNIIVIKQTELLNILAKSLGHKNLESLKKSLKDNYISIFHDNDTNNKKETVNFVLVDAKEQSINMYDSESFSLNNLSEILGYGLIGSYKMNEGMTAYFKIENYNETLCRGIIKGVQEFYGKALFVPQKGDDIIPFDASSKEVSDLLNKLIQYDDISLKIDSLLAKNATRLDDVIRSVKNIDDITYAELFHKLPDGHVRDRIEIYHILEKSFDEGILDQVLISLYEEITIDDKSIHGKRQNIKPGRSSLGNI